MKKILIADSSKASLVMTSEVFKDHYPGIQVLVAKTSAEAINLAKSTENIDAFIVDFDLPDVNGAQTALLLKKISKTPILITAFARQDVTDTIKTLLIKYEDCKSWLKKPVNPEVVIAVVQRYCDGKIRAQKRISCQLPVLAKMEVKEQIKKMKSAKPSVPKSAGAKSKAIAPKSEIVKVTKSGASEEKALPLYFYGIIEDCSLSGVKLKPSQHTSNGLTEWARLLENIEHIATGCSITLKMPDLFDIEIGKIHDLSKIHINNPEKEPKNKAVSKQKLPSQKARLKKEKEERIQEFEGKVIWTSSESGEWCMGIEFEDQALSKRLFEAVVSLQSRQHKGSQTQSIMKTSRAS